MDGRHKYISLRSQPLHAVADCKASAAYSSTSPACSLPARFDSPTMNNCITHHRTSPFNNAALTPHSSSTSRTSQYDVKFALLTSMGGGYRGTVGWSFLHDCTHIEAHLVAQGNSGIVLWCRVRKNTSCASVLLSASIRVCIGVCAHV